MNQQNQIGLLGQFKIACFQPRKYKTLLEKKTAGHIRYFVVFFLFLMLINAIVPFAAWYLSVGGFENLFLNRVPEFKLENGTMIMESPISFDIGGVLQVKVNSDKESFDAKDFDELYQEEFLISKNNIMIKVGGQMTNVELSSIKDMTMTNQDLVELIPYIDGMLVIYFLMSLLSEMIQYIIMALAFGLFCRAGVKAKDGRFLSIKEAFIISMYAKSLFAIVSGLNFCLGYLISSFWMMMISVAGTIDYIYRAELWLLQPEPGK
ncbi:MAG: DUF1189 family protein [Lachnospiraceae bacterium]|nr:DUF1189 family protein [Lachnospiraceae bacterium]